MKKLSWKHLKTVLPATAMFWAVCANPLHAQVQARAGVRADGMGGAFVAVSNDVSALQFSPAGLLNAPQRTQFQFGHHRLVPDLDITMNNVGLVHNLSLKRPSVDRLKPVLATDAAAPILASAPQNAAPDTSLHQISFGAQWQGLQLSGHSQNTLTFSIGVGLNGLGLLPKLRTPLAGHENVLQMPNRLALGFSLRYIRFGYDRNYLLNPDEVNDSSELKAIQDFLAAKRVEASDFAFDAGLNLYLSNQWQAAISIMNLRRPNLGAKNNESGKKPPEGLLGRRYRAGLAYHFSDNLLAALDIEKHDNTEGLVGDVNVFAGAEYWWQRALALRSGVNRNWFSAGFGLRLEKLVGWNFTLNGVYQQSLHDRELSNFRFAVDYGIKMRSNLGIQTK